MRTGETMIRVLVADDTRIHTQLLADSLRRDPLLEVFSPTSNSPDIVEAAVANKIDVAVLCSRLGDELSAGLEALRKMRSLRATVRGVVLLDSSKREAILESFRAGAKGLFSRDASLENLSECVRKVHAGEIWATSEQMAIALEALVASPPVRVVGANGLNLLSKRELEVVSSLAQGLSNREIAGRLGLSQHTIKNYLFKVFDKLGVSSRIELLFLTLSQHPANHLPQHLDGGSVGQGSPFSFAQRAAEQGMPISQMALAKMYSEGNGVQKDLLSSYMWYLICEKNILGMKDSINPERRKIAALLTTEEILEAQKLASERQKKPVQPESQGASRRILATAQI